MARPPSGVPLSPWQPAGYLPAPKQARFISEAEQAAEKLPPTIKAPSLKNALLKGGAKPLELEYAGIDDFVAQNQGKPISAADVLAHLKAEGPLGKLKRVEQQVVDGQPKWDFDQEEIIPTGPETTYAQYAKDVREPFDADRASNLTKYHDWTVAGRRGDFTGYREALIEDPKNNGMDFDRLVSDTSEGPDDDPWTGSVLAGPVDAHHSDYWVRYHEHPDRIDVQNIQSDFGQKYSKAEKGSDDEMTGVNRRLQENGQMRRKVIEDLDAPGLTPQQRSDLQFELDGLNQEQAEIVAENEHRFVLSYGDDGEEFFSQRVPPASPLSADDNWKNLMARHVALQSINGGGKPITIPTGQQMVDVEKFGGSTHNLHSKEGRQAAIKGADAYNTDLVRRLQKIFRGLHPDGASVSTPEPLATGAKSDFITAVDPDGANDMDERLFQKHLARIQDAIADRSSRPPHTDYFANREPDYGLREFDPTEFDPIEYGLRASSAGDNKLYEAIGSWDPAYVERVFDQNSSTISPELRGPAMQIIQHNRLMQEMGDPGVVRNHQTKAPTPPAPGWTIKPSPMAVRQALEKGLPIMSLLPLLLQPSQQENR